MIGQVDGVGIFRIVAHLVCALRTKMGRNGGTVVGHHYSFVPPRPRLSTVVGTISSSRRNPNHHALRIARIGQDRMQTKPAESRHPVWTLRMIQQRFDRMKGLAAIVGAIERAGSAPANTTSSPTSGAGS